MIPSYFKIEILAIQDEFVLLGHKGLNSFCLAFHRQCYDFGCPVLLLAAHNYTECSEGRERPWGGVGAVAQMT